MIRNIVFDMGGVLLDYAPQRTCQRLAATPEDAQAILETLFRCPEWENQLDAGLIPEDEMLALVQSRLATQAQREAAALIFGDYPSDGCTPMPQMEALVQALHARGFHIFLLSNVGVRFYEYQHKIPGISLFDGRVLSCEEKVLKPKAAIYERLLQKYDLAAEECLFVDDRQQNTDGAQAVGMAGYCFQDGDVARLSAYLAALPSPSA